MSDADDIIYAPISPEPPEVTMTCGNCKQVIVNCDHPWATYCAHAGCRNIVHINPHFHKSQ